MVTTIAEAYAEIGRPMSADERRAFGKETGPAPKPTPRPSPFAHAATPEEFQQFMLAFLGPPPKREPVMVTLNLWALKSETSRLLAGERPDLSAKIVEILRARAEAVHQHLRPLP
jgi:hypothetical protein